MRSAVFAQTLTSGQTLPTDGLNLKQVWDNICLIIPSAPSGSIQLYASESLSGTYYPVVTENYITFSVANIHTINSGLVANGLAVNFQAHAQFVKVRNTSGVTDAVTTFKIICSENY